MCHRRRLSSSIGVSALAASGGGGGSLKTTRKYIYFHDGNGNVGQVVDWLNGGAIAAHYEYDPYGRPLIEHWDIYANEGNGGWVATGVGGSSVPAGGLCYSAYGNPFMWTGQRYDAVTGLYAFLFRSYSPTLGRWLQRDPAGYVDGANLYQYVRGNPTSLHDPYGLCGCQQSSNQPSGAQPASSQAATSQKCKKTDEELCEQAKKNGVDKDHDTGKPDAGGIICVDGRAIACVWQKPSGENLDPRAATGIELCMKNHEREHAARAAGDCKNSPGTEENPDRPIGHFLNVWREEVIVWDGTVDCLQAGIRDRLCEGAQDPVLCKVGLQAAKEWAEQNRDKYKKKIADWEKKRKHRPSAPSRLNQP